MSLKEIATLNEERREGHLTCERGIEVLSAQLVRLEAKATELEMMKSYVRAKIDWLTRGKQGQQPDFESYARGGSCGSSCF
jgi:DNA-binding transcriptional MerR regulator